jgi:chitinase
MITRKRKLLLLGLIIFAAACSKKSDPPPPQPPVIAPPPDLGFKVVGYIPYYRDPATVPDIKFRMTNVVNYAFATINAGGVPVVNNTGRLAQVVTKAKANNAKVFISINGVPADFKTMASTPAGRNGFIIATMNIVRQFQLDGVDVDWEFPSTADGSDQTFTLLMKELSDSCHTNSKYYLTAAITAGKYAGSFRDAIKSELFNYVDWLNVMAYDDFSTTVPYRHHSNYGLAETCLNYWLNTRGMPKSKCVLGLPAYGRPSGISQSSNVLTYADILSKGGSPLSDSAMVTSTATPTPYMIYYNGQPTIKLKTMLAKQVANGVMLWEKGQDSHDNTSLLKAVCDTIGRAY